MGIPGAAVTDLEAIRQFAEEPSPEMPEPWLPGRRFIRPAYTLNLGGDPTVSFVTRVRTSEADLDATLAEVRAVVRQHGYTHCTWNVGPSCRPAGLTELLLARGFVPATAPLEPYYTAMTMTREPPMPSPAAGVEARLVQSVDEYVAAYSTGLRAHGESEQVIASLVESAPTAWADESGLARMSHVAFADGQMAGIGLVSYGPSAIFLGGAVVLPQYRGRGVYRALVASRWRAAVELGKPALAIHAGAMSRPILERCGFEALCRIDVLVDPTLG
jgi:GNAT superfamily N-acetyltransferase